MNLKYTLYSVDADETKEIKPRGYDLPVGAKEEQYTLKRSDLFEGFMREFSETLGFYKHVNIWLRGLFDTYGLETQINITKYIYDSDNFEWDEVVSGVLNNTIYTQNKKLLELNYNDSTIQRNINNFADTEIEYNSLFSLDGSALDGWVSEFQDVTLYGVSFASTSVKMEFPFEVINRLIQKICNVSDDILRSELFGRVDMSNITGFDNYAYNGYFSYWMITNEKLLRQVSPNGTGSKVSGKTDLVIELQKLLDTFNTIKPLGMGIEQELQDDGTYLTVVRIEEKDWFYRNNQYSFYLASGDILKVRRYVNEKENFNKLTIGSENTKNNDELGLIDYLNKATYITPLLSFNNEKRIVAPYSFDPVGIEWCRQNPITGGDQERSDYDGQVFIIDCFLDGATIKSRNDANPPTGLDSVSGVYGTYSLYTNLRAISSYLVRNHGKWLRIGLEKYTDKYLRFQNMEALSKVSVQVSGDAFIATNGENILISDLDSAIISPFMYDIDCYLTKAEFTEIKNNPFNILKFWEPDQKTYKYLWIHELKHTVYKNKAFITGYEVLDIDTLLALYWGTEVDNEIFQAEDDSYVLLENAS